MHKRKWCAALLALALVPACALGAEGDPLLSVDDLLSLEDSYQAFLSELEELIVERGLLSEEERGAWHDAQMGDFFQNGGYGSLLINYTPGVLSYMREEETLLALQTPVDALTMELLTVRRYTPQDSSLSGLMLTPTVKDAAGVPQDVRYTLRATSGVFLKWDAMLGAYVSVGAVAQSNGETVVWSDQTPAANARGPIITFSVIDPEENDLLGEAALSLSVDGTGYRVEDGALSEVKKALEPEPSAQAEK